jgi:5-methylcytosine-specific restriction endonuclease McrA
MTWENQGKCMSNYNETWQLDHIIPISNAKSIEDVIKLNHYTNLRPLCSKLNLEKSNH